MKKTSFLLAAMLGFVQAFCLAQTNTNPPTNNHQAVRPIAANADASCPITITGKDYIFKGYLKLTQCTPSGDPLSDDLKVKGDVYSEPQTIFKIGGIKSSDCSVIIYYDLNFTEENKLAIYNYINIKDTTSNGEISELPANLRFFIISKDQFLQYAEEYTHTSKFGFTFGTFTYPFKYRTQKSYFTSNLSLGSSVSGKYQWNDNNSIGGIFSLSLSSVTLDSASTNGVVKTSTDRPALTPSLGIVYAYKSINFTVGMGWDFINRPSPIEKSWIYHGKNWIGFGIGINLFSTVSSSSAPEKNDEQSGKNKSKVSSIKSTTPN